MSSEGSIVRRRSLVVGGVVGRLSAPNAGKNVNGECKAKRLDEDLIDGAARNHFRKDKTSFLLATNHYYLKSTKPYTRSQMMALLACWALIVAYAVVINLQRTPFHPTSFVFVTCNTVTWPFCIEDML